MTIPYKSSTVAVHVTCAVFFLIFAFCYLYSYQADVLAATQHVLSKGQTHYDRTIGAVLITIIAWLLQLAIYAFAKTRGYFLALTYLPSMLLLGILTDADDSLLQGGYMGGWLWGYPLLLVAWGGLLWFIRQYEGVHHTDKSPLLRQLWINLAQLVVMACIATAVGSTDKVFHYRMQAEQRMLKGQYDEVLRIGYGEEATDSSLTFLRIWALSQKNALGERLFEYPIVGGADAMMPDSASVRLILIPELRYYRHLGGRFIQSMPAMTYLQKLHKIGKARPAAHDWLLTAYLLEGDLKAFNAALPRYYNMEKELPKHYREALILYNHSKGATNVVYHNEVMETDYQDFLTLQRSHKDPRMQDAALRDSYSKSYWYYYYRLKKH